MSRRAFISHSSDDKAVAEEIGKALGKADVWVDFWDLDLGDVLPRDIAEAVESAKWFVLVASRASMGSRWVRYELNLAVLRWIKRADCRIAVLRIDDCDIHPELSPFLRIECQDDIQRGIAEIKDKIMAGAPTPVKAPRDSRLGFVNRFDAIQAVEDLTYRGVRALFLWGIFGIGKTALARRIARELFQAPVERFALSEAHGPLRLCMELSARAGLRFPDENDTHDVLTDLSARAVAALVKRGALVLFDNVENTLADDPTLPPFLTALISVLLTQHDLQVPVLFCSSRQPSLVTLPSDSQSETHIMRLDALSDKHLVFCLENWLRLTQPESEIPSIEKLKELASNLYGYPLGAQLAAISISRDSIEALLEEPWRIKELRIDIARRLLGTARQKLTDLELTCLEVLAVAETGATIRELVEVLKQDKSNVTEAIDGLSRSLLVVPDEGLLGLHPLVREHFWSRAYKSGHWKEYASNLGGIVKRRTEELAIGTEEMVRECARAYRLLTLSGRKPEARSLVYSFQEELKGVIRRLYHARENELALEYVDLWLQAAPKDHRIRWYRARLFTRFSRYPEALQELQTLSNAGYTPYMVNHAFGLLERERRNYKAAFDYFTEGLKSRKNYIPLLRDKGDICLRLNLVPEAVESLQQANGISPNDPYVVPVLVDALLADERVQEAVDVLLDAIKAQPEEAALHHRLSTVLERMDNRSQALLEAREAVRLASDRQPEAHLNLAALELRYGGGAAKAEEVLAGMPRHLPQHTQRVRANLAGLIALNKGDRHGARQVLKNFDAYSDPYSADLKLKVEIQDLLAALKDRSPEAITARLRVARATKDEVLAHFPDNREITKAADRLREIEEEYALGE